MICCRNYGQTLSQRPSGLARGLLEVLGGLYFYRLVGDPKLSEASRDILNFPSYKGPRAFTSKTHGTNSSNFKPIPNLDPGPPQGYKRPAPNPEFRRDPKFPQGFKLPVATLSLEVPGPFTRVQDS